MAAAVGTGKSGPHRGRRPEQAAAARAEAPYWGRGEGVSTAWGWVETPFPPALPEVANDSFGTSEVPNESFAAPAQDVVQAFPLSEIAAGLPFTVPAVPVKPNSALPPAGMVLFQPASSAVTAAPFWVT